MNPDDYIRGERHGEEAHDLELEAMRDPLLGDALDGFDAVPGDHSAAFERLAERLDASSTGGRAAARARSSRLREGRIRGWSVAAAGVFLAAAFGGGVWMLHDGIPGEETNTAARPAAYGGHRDEVVEILPPVTVIGNDEEPVAPTETDGVRFDKDEVPVIDDATAAGSAPERDTVTTVRFRRYVYDWNIARSAVLGSVTLSFDVDADGRPQNIEATEAPSPETAKVAVELLQNGPGWPTRPSRKQITINL